MISSVAADRDIVDGGGGGGGAAVVTDTVYTRYRVPEIPDDSGAVITRS